VALAAINSLPAQVKQYLVITGNYWAFTLTDGALRMLVVLYFHQLGYDAFAIATLFLFYEFFGVVTNLIGGWLGARLGLNKTMNIGLTLQIAALLMLTVSTEQLTVLWVMFAQALSGIAKDLNKMSAKSAIKTLLPEDAQRALFKWVAILTGSKNALKGVGFFLGALLLTLFGFSQSIWLMAMMLMVVAALSFILLKQDLGKAKFKPKFKDIFSKSRAINYLSAARLFLFAARDVWFVVALPVYFSQQLGWQHWQVGSFMAAWIIGYGFIQTLAPKITSRNKQTSAQVAIGKTFFWGAILTFVTFILTIAYYFLSGESVWLLSLLLVTGLLLFGGCFAINSSLHSYLIVSIANSDGVSLDVGFYYMANAMGRLIGTILSGYLFVQGGLLSCLMVSTVMLAVATLTIKKMPVAQSTNNT
jgi:MFS family permease